jgi:hypothetical protein
MRRLHRVLESILALAAVCTPAFAELPKPAHPRWTPLADTVYLQEASRHIVSKHPLAAVAIYAGQTYVGDQEGLWTVQGDALRKQADGPQQAVAHLKVLDDALWAIASDGLWKFDRRSWIKVSEAAVADLCMHQNRVIVAGNGLFTVDENSLKPLLKEQRPGLRGVASYAGSLYVHDGKQLAVLEGNQLSPDEVADWGMLPPGATIRQMMSRGNGLLLATDKGLAMLRGMTWYLIQGEDGLPYEDTTCLAPGFADDLWIGTTRGAIRNVGQQYQYFGYQRWLPHNKVNAIACGERVAVIATEGGLGIIDYEPYTLAKKAAWYERWLIEWGQKRLGFVHMLTWRDDHWVRDVCDNDVGFSTHYLAGLCFKYAVTKDPAARAEAVDMMKSVKWSEEITGIDGFPARAVWAVGEKENKDMFGSAGLPAEWNPTPDGRWEWKGDTSSDELIAQVYICMVFLELAAGPEQRPWVVEHLDRVIGHIVREGFVLRDLDGKPTRWARWDPEYLLHAEGVNERGLNALQAFSFLETAAHFTHNPKFTAAEKQILAWGYADNVLRQKITFPPEWFTHFDDRLAFLAYFPLLTYETDPALKARWLRSFERSWEIKRIEGIPWFNFVYGATTGQECENERAVAFLREAPLDMRQYSYFNSHRADLKRIPNGYRMYAERGRPLSPRETALQKWHGDFMALDSNSKGLSIEDCSAWIEAYWMGRYFGLISKPTVTDAALLSVPKRDLHLGAKPYSGPPRPKLRHEQASAGG